MAMCMLCRRNILVGESYRVWRAPSGLGERPVCRLCEDEADGAGWVRLEKPLEQEKGSLIWHARKVA